MAHSNPIEILMKQTNQLQIPKVILNEISERVHKSSNGIPDHKILKFL